MPVGNGIEGLKFGTQHTAIAADPCIATPVVDELEHRIHRHTLLQTHACKHAIALAIQAAIGRDPHGIADGLKTEHAARAAQFFQIQLAQLAVA